MKLRWLFTFFFEKMKKKEADQIKLNKYIPYNELHMTSKFDMKRE